MTKRASGAIRTVPATEFKARCLALIDRVAEHKSTITISKRGRPVARLVPLRGAEREPRKPLIGCVTILDPDDDLLSTNAVWESQAPRRRR